MPKFSIIMPVYNVEGYVARTVESVLSQTFDSWELICTDDGSVDSSGEILDVFVARDSRIKVVHQINSGEGAARNSALDKASGEWLVFLDADDLLSPSALKDWYAAIERFPFADLIRGGLVEFEDPDEYNLSLCNGAREERALICDDLSRIISTAFVRSHFFQIAYRRETVKDLRFTGFYVGADLVYLNEAICLAKTGIRIPQIVYGYRKRCGSIINSPMSRRKIVDSIGYKKAIWDSYVRVAKEIPPPVVRQLVTRYAEWTVYEIMRVPSNERMAAWAEWFASLRYFRNIRPLNHWFRFCMMICDILRLRALAVILFALPHRIKLGGIHR